MDEWRITAEWARLSKAFRSSAGYHVLAASEAGQPDRYADRYISVVPDEHSQSRVVPWVTFGPLVNAEDPLISITVLGPLEERDDLGRSIWVQRFFVLRYDDAAAGGASFQQLWDAVKNLELLDTDRQPLVLRGGFQSVNDLIATIEGYGVERMTAIAALLLEREVALDPAELPPVDRLAVLDAVLALLPYGLRAGLSATTAVGNNTLGHNIDLIFASFAADQPVVPLAYPAPIPPPATDLGRAYLRTLRETIETVGLSAVMEHLWAAKAPLSRDGSRDALAILTELAFPPAMMAVIRAEEAFASQIAAESDAREGVQFAVSYPGTLVPDARQPLYVLVYREGIRDQANVRLAELEGRLAPHPRQASRPANSRIDEGTKLKIQPLISNVNCYPPRRIVTWRNELAEATFKIECTRAPVASRRPTGSILVSSGGGTLITQIPMSFTISEAAAAPMTQRRRATADMARHVFGSYAHEDAAVVTSFREAYRALGIHLFIDVMDMPGGARWKRYLEQQIERSDIFQLFWSYASAASPQVENEWRHALRVAGKRPPETDFIRPLYWSKPWPGPPDELSEIQFCYVDLRAFGFGAQDSEPASRAKGWPLINALIRFIRWLR